MIMAVMRALWQRHTDRRRYRALIAEIERVNAREDLLTFTDIVPVRQSR